MRPTTHSRSTASSSPRSGIAFYVCPGTSSWCSIAGRTDNAIGNLRNAAESGLKNGAIGYLNTDWGDMGHWQVLPVSFLGFAVGAAYSWALEANRTMDVPAVVSLHAFRDPTGVMGRVAYDLGNVYKSAGVLMPNSSLLFWTLQPDFARELATHIAGTGEAGLRFPACCHRQGHGAHRHRRACSAPTRP